MIEVQNIKKSFGSLEVLKGIDLQIQRGEVVSIVGPSGAGKTTLLQIMGTLDKPDSGSVIVDGIDVMKLSDARRSAFRNKHMGFVFQFHQLLPEFTALENVMMPALIGGVSKREARHQEPLSISLMSFLLMNPVARSIAKTNRNFTVFSSTFATAWDRLSSLLLMTNNSQPSPTEKSPCKTGK